MSSEQTLPQAALYVRVSTQEQATEGYSIQAQLERLRAYCTARGWQVAHEYVDPGYSGAKLDRPAIQQLIADIRQSVTDLDVVVVFKLDRLSRSQKDTLFLIEDVFLKNQINFISMNESFDTTTPYGVAMIGILSAFAQLERENIKLRTQMGLEERAKEGYWRGGGHPPIGYRYNPSTGILQVHPDEAMQIQKIFDLFVNQQKSLRQIAFQMARQYPDRAGTYASSSDIAQILKRKTYLGYVPWKGQFYPGRHEPLISVSTFSRAQQLLYQASPKAISRHGFLLTGLIWCGQCGARYYAMGAYRGPKANRTLVHTYTCYSRAKTSPKMVRDPHCKNKNWPVTDLETILWDTCCALHWKAFDLPQSSLAPTSAQIQKRLSEIDQQMARLVDLYEMQPMDEITARLERLRREKSRLSDALRQAAPSPSLSHANTLEGEQVRDLLRHATWQQKQRILRTLIDRIVLQGDTIDIYWNF
ncbi:MAG: recombinase family protein [Butyricicoccus sp.]|nr:recombinase family protein [Butyricicoccus sp.]